MHQGTQPDLSDAVFSSRHTFVRELGLLLWQSLWPLFGLNLALALVSGGAVALGLLLGLGPLLLLTALVVYPAWSALLAAVAGQVLNRRGHAWAHAGQALRRNGLMSAVLGLFVNLMLYSYMTAGALAVSPAAGLWLRVVWVGQSIFLVVLATAAVYAFPLIALYAQPLRLAVRNGLLLAVGAPGPTTAMLGGVGLTGLAFFWLNLGAATFAPLVLAVLLVANCLLQVNIRRNQDVRGKHADG